MKRAAIVGALIACCGCAADTSSPDPDQSAADVANTDARVSDATAREGTGGDGTGGDGTGGDGTGGDGTEPGDTGTVDGTAPIDSRLADGPASADSRTPDGPSADQVVALPDVTPSVDAPPAADLGGGDAGSADGGLLPAITSQGPYTLALTAPPDGHFEVPFWVLPGGNRQLTVTTAYSYACHTPKNPLTDTIALFAGQCSLVLRDTIHKGNTFAPWRLSYNGIFSQHVVSTGTGELLVAINHGENKNECLGGLHSGCGAANLSGCSGGTCHANTINTNITCASCSSGYDACGDYHDCWDAYNALVTLSWQHYDAAHAWGMDPHQEEGPIVWPANGYTVGGQKSSAGVRHPHGLVAGGYLYLFFLDASFGSGNRGPGIKLARAPLSSAGFPGHWKTYCGGAWVDALPSGFNAGAMDSYYDQQGGCSSAIVSGPSNVSFAAARTTQGRYLGVLEGMDSANHWQVSLWLSSDLKQWAQVGVLRDKAGGWGQGDLHYPVLLSDDGWSNELVDETSFYVVGSQGGQVRAMAVAVQ